MTALDKMREQNAKLKAEVSEEQEQKEAAKAKIENQLASIQQDPELAKLYKDNAKVGSENIGGSYPYLRIHTASSTSNELQDGTQPTQGYYFYAPTKQQFKELTCHILTVSRGFKVWQEDKETGKKKEQFNQVIGGVLVDEGEFKPFLMYINGLKCQPLWKFGKDAAEYTRAGIPMFAMVVNATTEQVKTEKYGFKWVPKFTISKIADKPELVLDVETFKMLRNGVTKLEGEIAALIDSKASEDVAATAAPAVNVHAELADPTPTSDDPEQEVKPSDIPF